MKYAPIVVFAFNRLDSLCCTIDSLLQNEEAKESSLFIFVDGPRANKTGESEKVNSVREYVRQISGFGSVSYEFSDENKGLGPSIISGVSKVIAENGRAIVLEDDLRFTGNFLSFMNQALDRYEAEKEVFSICGYSNHVVRPSGYDADSYFCPRSSSWGWATWQDRWVSVDWYLEPFEKYGCFKSKFNRWGGSDCFGMLKGWHDGRNKSWAIRFCFSQFLQDKVSLFPMESKVINDGFDGQGTNCKSWSRFHFDEDRSGRTDFMWPSDISVIKPLRKGVLRYHSIWKRVYSRIMYRIYG